MSFPPIPSKIGKKGALIDIDGNKQHFIILDEVTHVQSTYPGKVSSQYSGAAPVLGDF